MRATKASPYVLYSPHPTDTCARRSGAKRTMTSIESRGTGGLPRTEDEEGSVGPRERGCKAFVVVSAHASRVRKGATQSRVSDTREMTVYILV